MQTGNLTQGSVGKNLLRFSLPYLLSCFLQTFYGLADLFIAGQFNGAATITAVSVGSQVMHMFTVVTAGLAMGSTVRISRSVGAGDSRGVSRAVGNTVTIFALYAAGATALLLWGTDGVLRLLSAPPEAAGEAGAYLRICFAGIPFITAYNVVSSVFRGLGDSRRPMYFVAAAGLVNVGLDVLFIGPLGMGAAGAALATVLAQLFSVLLSLWYMRSRRTAAVSRADLRPERETCRALLRVGVPVAVQDGFVQIAFLLITVIANHRGVAVAAAVGIVEKVIGFLFLVPSAMLSAVSAIAAQNAGAGLHRRGRQTLFYAIGISVGAGLCFALICQFRAEDVLRLFAREEAEVIALGGGYLRSYVFDCAIAGVHFCFSGYFCAYQRSLLSFVHNLVAIVLMRIPGAYLASVYYPETLFPMGMAAPLGSLLSAFICAGAYLYLRKTKKLPD